MSTSIFGTSLATPIIRREALTGPLNGTAARVMLRTIAEHHDVPLADVRAQLGALFPRARGHLLSPAGWALLSGCVGYGLPDAEPLALALH